MYVRPIPVPYWTDIYHPYRAVHYSTANLASDNKITITERDKCKTTEDQSSKKGLQPEAYNLYFLNKRTAKSLSHRHDYLYRRLLPSVLNLVVITNNNLSRAVSQFTG